MTASPVNLTDINQVLLRRKMKLVVDSSFSSSVENEWIVLSLLKDIEDLGFIFSRELFDLLKFQSEDALVAYHDQLVSVLPEMVGAHVKHKPFYKNFPQQMASLSDLDLLMNALVHYWTNGQWQPEYVEVSRLPLKDSTPQTRVIDVGEVADFHQIFIDMMASKGSLSAEDQDLLGWYIDVVDADDLAIAMPSAIPSKETLSLVAARVMMSHPARMDLVAPFIRTATDVLRIVTALSEGDISLASRTYYRQFTRPERRFILALLEDCHHIEEDMGRYPGKWKRLGEILHPGDYADRYPKVYGVFTKIRNDERHYSFAAAVEKAINSSELEDVLDLLMARPGEFARRLDFLARSFLEDTQKIVDHFADAAGQVASMVLLQVMTHFSCRDQERSRRAFFPKGNIAKVQVVEKPLPALPTSFCLQIINICETALVQRFKEKSPLGKAAIDPVLKDVVVPIAQRASSRTLQTYARGSKFDFGDQGRVIRAFLHWKNVTIHIPPVSSSDASTPFEEGAPIQDWQDVLRGVIAPASEGQQDGEMMQIRTDIDLSLGLYDAEWQYKEHISYTHIRSDDIEGLCHSGDIVDAPEGASEFIDLDIENLLENDIRYAVFEIYSYTRQGFNEIPECFFGWMEREDVDSGEIFEPKTVVNKIDLASPTTICLPVLFDLETRKVVWMDISLRSHPRWQNSLEANSNNVVLISRAMIDLEKPNLYDLFRLNVQARGELVNDPEEADITFGISETDDVTPFQVEHILADFL